MQQLENERNVEKTEQIDRTKYDHFNYTSRYVVDTNKKFRFFSYIS